MEVNVMPEEQKAFIETIKEHEIEVTNMTENEAIDFAFRVWQDRNWLKEFISMVTP